MSSSMNAHSEVCLWTLVGLVRTIFDATLFKVNSNLKQVWQMTMPEELSLPIQRLLRTVISSVMLVQCFTVYVYLASYIVLLYPVFLEERPTLVLPWLLLAAIRKLLCELTSLAVGLGTCLLVGPARPPCIKFVLTKAITITPAFYMWMLVFSYYHILKVASAFKTFTTATPSGSNDYGLELAVRRRRTKSLFGEEQLRRKLVASLYGEKHLTTTLGGELYSIPNKERYSPIVHSTEANIDNSKEGVEYFKPLSITSNRISETGSYEDWLTNEGSIPRDTDRILEQFVLMLLRICIYLKTEETDAVDSHNFNTCSPNGSAKSDKLDSSAVPDCDIESSSAMSNLKEQIQLPMNDNNDSLKDEISVVIEEKSSDTSNHILMESSSLSDTSK